MTVKNFPTFESQKQWLIDNIVFTAGWREEKAEQYPDDERNAHCARTLHEIAQAVMVLPATHDLFRKIAGIDRVDDSALESWLDEVNYLLSRAGFDGPDNAESVIGQLTAVTETALSETQQQGYS